MQYSHTCRGIDLNMPRISGLNGTLTLEIHWQQAMRDADYLAEHRNLSSCKWLIAAELEADADLDRKYTLRQGLWLWDFSPTRGDSGVFLAPAGWIQENHSYFQAFSGDNAKIIPAMCKNKAQIYYYLLSTAAIYKYFKYTSKFNFRYVNFRRNIAVTIANTA